MNEKKETRKMNRERKFTSHSFPFKGEFAGPVATKVVLKSEWGFRWYDFATWADCSNLFNLLNPFNLTNFIDKGTKPPPYKPPKTNTKREPTLQ